MADCNQDLPPHCFLVGSMLLLFVYVFLFIWSLLLLVSNDGLYQKLPANLKTSRLLVSLLFVSFSALVVVHIRSWLQMPLLVSTKNLPLTAPS